MSELKKRSGTDFIYDYYDSMNIENMVDMLYCMALDRLKHHGTAEREVWEETANDGGYELTWDEEDE